MTERMCLLAREWEEQKSGIIQGSLRKEGLEKVKEICSKLFNRTTFSSYLCKSHLTSLCFHILSQATEMQTGSVLRLC